MLSLGRGGLLYLAAAGAELQQLAIGLAGGIADDDGAALKGVAWGIDQCILKDHKNTSFFLLFHPV